MLDGLALKCREHACRIYGLGTLNIVAVESIYWYVVVCCGAVGYGKERQIGAVKRYVARCNHVVDPRAMGITTVGTDVDIVGGGACKSCGGECRDAGDLIDSAVVAVGV